MAILVNNPIRILYIHHGSGSGGAPNALLSLLHNLDRNQVAPIVACGFSEPTAKDFFENQGFAPVDIPAARFSHVASWWPLYKPRGVAKALEWLIIKHPRSLYELKKTLWQTKPDIVHLNSLTIAPLAPMIRRMGIPVVLHVREPVAEGTFGIRRLWLRHLARNYASHVIYICKDNQDRLTGPMPHASVIHDPIPFSKFDHNIDRDTTKRELGISPASKVLFFPGGSSLRIKGIFPFLQALAIVIKQHPGACAVIPGIDLPMKSHNQERKDIEEMISQLQLNTHIVRVPFSTTVERYYAAADVVLAPFIRPHASLAVLEAGAMKKPVIGSKVGGIEEVLIDGITGLFCKPGDSGHLAAMISALLSDPEKAQALGSAAYDYVKKCFDIQLCANSVLSVYESLIDSAPVSRKSPAQNAPSQG